MNFRILIAFTTLATSALFSQAPPTPPSDASTQWQIIDQLCGQLELTDPKEKQIVVDGKAESRFYTAYLEGTAVNLYPGTSGEKECCDRKPMATVQSRKYGAFEFEGVQHGNYWPRVQKGDLIRLIPVRVTHDFDQRVCHDPSVGRSIVVDSNPPKIETRIR